MNTRLKTILAVGVLAGFAMPASATPMLEIVGGTAGLLPEYTHHGDSNTAELPGFYNASIKALVDTDLQYELLFSDPGPLVHPSGDPTVNLVVDGNVIPNPFDTASGHVDAGELLDFAMRIISGGTTTYVSNGSNHPRVPYRPSFWAGWTDDSFNQLIVAFEDGTFEPGLPAGDLDQGDYDDLVIMITAKPVSEPATLTLLGAGLLLTGLGVRTRRRNLVKSV